MTSVYLLGALLLADLLYVEALGMWELFRHPGNEWDR